MHISRSLVLSLALLGAGGPALAANIDELINQTDEATQIAIGQRGGIEDSIEGGPAPEGCYQYTINPGAGKPPSLLGVPYQGGVQQPAARPSASGNERIRLTSSHPAIVDLRAKEKKLEELNAAAEASVRKSKAFGDMGYQAASWDTAVEVITKKIDWKETEVTGTQGVVKRFEKLVPEQQASVAIQDTPEMRKMVKRQAEDSERTLAEYREKLEVQKKELADLESRLPELKKGQAVYKKQAEPAQAALKQAMERANQAGAKCPA